MPVSMTFSSLQSDVQQYLERGTSVSDSTVYNQIPKLIDLAERKICRALKIQGFIKPRTSTFQVGASVQAKPNRWRQTVSMNFGRPTVLWNPQSRSSVGTTRTLTLDRPNTVAAGQNIVVSNVGTGYDGSFVVTAAGYMTVSYVGPTSLTEVVAVSGFLALSNSFVARTPLLPRSYETLRELWPDESQLGTPRYYADYDYSHWLVAPTPRLPYPFEENSYELPEQLDSTQQTSFLTEFAPEVLLFGTLTEAEPYIKEDSRLKLWEDKFTSALAAINSEDLGKIMDRAAQRTGA